MASATLVESLQDTRPLPLESKHTNSSYQTARSMSQSQSHRSSYFDSSPSRSSSVHTLGPAPHIQETINPIHQISSQTQEIHIVKVSKDRVQLETGPIPDTFVHKVGKSLSNAVSCGNDELESPPSVTVGPFPPSPPASVTEVEAMATNPSLPPTQPRNMITTDPESGPSVTFLPRAHSSNIPSTIKGRTSIENKSFTSSRISDDSSFPGPDGSSSRGDDGYLHPPSNFPVRHPARRNTTGSAPRHSGPGKSAHGHHSSFGVEDGSVGELATDIQIQAEQILRERESRRLQQEYENSLVKEKQPKPKIEDDSNPLVGNLIGEDHVNYVLMYNMLTGIRIGVSRCQAKVKRPLTDEDFVARHKFSFDIVGNELTPSAKYDFKFKDYAPWVFRELREDHFNLDPADYLLSLTAKYILSELGSPGKSGSFFYFSRDYRFIIKTIRHSEHKFLLSILKQYYEHVKGNPHTLISRFYGLHRVKLPRGRKIHFVIMNNLFPPHKDIHETYDLKGSTVGREYPEEKAANNPRAVLKDLNWINRHRTLDLGPEKRALLTEQIRRDSELLKRVHVMDYSLLVGIHNMRRGNRDNLRSNTLKVFSPDVPLMRRRKANQSKGGSSPEAVAMRQAMRDTDAKRLGAHGSVDLPEQDARDGDSFIFYQDEGGLRATDEVNDDLDKIYYLGIIDILTPYSLAKKFEHVWKGLSADRHKISPVNPVEYADRFFGFMKSIMRTGSTDEKQGQHDSTDQGSSDPNPSGHLKSE